jgi:small GTP-binding protein
MRVTSNFLGTPKDHFLMFLKSAASHDEIFGPVPPRARRPSWNPQDISLLDVKIAVVGVQRVGKTSIVRQFCENKFSTETDETMEDWYQKRMMVKDELTTREVAVSMDIVDTSGDVMCVLMSESVLKNCDGFLLVYNVANTHSFILAESFFKNIRNQLQTTKTPAVLVANMCDLEQEKQKVDEKAGRDLASKMNFPYCRVSGKSRDGIDEAFSTLIREILKARRAPMVMRAPVFVDEIQE